VRQAVNELLDLSDEVIPQTLEYDVYGVPTLELWNGVSNCMERFIAAESQARNDSHDYFTLFEERMPIILMHEAGMTPLQIIVTVTQ
jgi:hypothetical protein